MKYQLPNDEARMVLEQMLAHLKITLGELQYEILVRKALKNVKRQVYSLKEVNNDK